MRKLFDDLNIRKEFSSFHDLLNSWEELVKECEEGYKDNQYELDYDLIVRSEIKVLVESEHFKKEREYEHFIKKVRNIDESFLKTINFLDDQITNDFWKRKFILKSK